MESTVMLENCLCLTKSLAMLDINAVIESQNNKVKSYMTSILIIVLELQEQLYDFMAKKGYYKVENVKQTDIKKLIKKLKGNE